MSNETKTTGGIKNMAYAPATIVHLLQEIEAILEMLPSEYENSLRHGKRFHATLKLELSLKAKTKDQLAHGSTEPFEVNANPGALEPGNQVYHILTNAQFFIHTVIEKDGIALCSLTEGGDPIHTFNLKDLRRVHPLKAMKGGLGK